MILLVQPPTKWRNYRDISLWRGLCKYFEGFIVLNSLPMNSSGKSTHYKGNLESNCKNLEATGLLTTETKCILETLEPRAFTQTPCGFTKEFWDMFSTWNILVSVCCFWSDRMTVFFLFCFVFFVFCFFFVLEVVGLWDRVSPCSPGCPGTPTVDQADLKLWSLCFCLLSAGITGVSHLMRATDYAPILKCFLMYLLFAFKTTTQMLSYY